jgi:hypothetical protein
VVKVRKRAGEPSGAAPSADVDDSTDDKPQRIIVCASCGMRITDAETRIEISGRHQHTCVNPAGYVYRIGCFARAAGCIGQGEWSDYHSWFKGYYWQIACCGRCSIHLGWGFTGEGPDFHGLIVDRIEERDEGD